LGWGDPEAPGVTFAPLPDDKVLGRGSWGATPVLGDDVFIDGLRLDVQSSRAFTTPGQLNVIPLLSGTSFVQNVLSHPDAPESLVADSHTFTLQLQTVQSYFAGRAVLDQVVDLWIERPVDVVWHLRLNDPRTVFTLPRPTPGLLVDTTAAGKYTPIAAIRDFPKPFLGTDVDLTVIEVGPSVAVGEILIDPTIETTTVETGDLAGELDGSRALWVRYYPLRLCVGGPEQISHGDGGLVSTFTLDESVVAADYD
jgi:hypothetical protein